MTELPTRRDFLKQTALAATALAGSSLHCVAASEPPGQTSTALPWYRRTLRWGQTNITEMDPEGYTDNSWSGLGRGSPCSCENCRKRFRQRTGQAIPPDKNWNNPLYRQWIQWNYERRLELWDLNNLVTKAAGGPDCIWVGMNSGSIAGQSQSFRDYREVCRRAEIIMLDHQSRSDATGFQHNGEAGKLIHGLL